MKPAMKIFGSNASLMLSAIFILLAPVIGPISLFVGIFLFYLSTILFAYEYNKAFNTIVLSIHSVKNSGKAIFFSVFLGALAIFTPAFMPLFLPDIAPDLILAGSIASIVLLVLVTVYCLYYLIGVRKAIKKNIVKLRKVNSINDSEKAIKIFRNRGVFLSIGSISAIIIFSGLIVNPDISLFLSGGVVFPIAAVMITITGLYACIFAFLKFSDMISKNKKSLAENKKSSAKANKKSSAKANNQLMLLKFITLILGIAVLAAGSLGGTAIFAPESLAAAIPIASIVAGSLVVIVLVKLLSDKFGPKKTAIGVALVLAALAALASLGVSIQSLISASPLVPGIAAISTISALVVLGLTLLTNYLLAKKQDNKLTTVGTIISFLSFVAIGLGIVSKLAPVAFLSEALFLGLIVGGISLIITSALIYIFRNELQEYGMSILGGVGLLAILPSGALLFINADVFAADLQLPFVQENLAIFIAALAVGIVLIAGYFAEESYKNSKNNNASVVGGAVPGAAAPVPVPAAAPAAPAPEVGASPGAPAPEVAASPGAPAPAEPPGASS